MLLALVINVRLGLWRVGGAYVARRTGGDSSRRFDANGRQSLQEGQERVRRSSIRAESILKKFRKFLPKVRFLDFLSQKTPKTCPKTRRHYAKKIFAPSKKSLNTVDNSIELSTVFSDFSLTFTS